MRFYDSQASKLVISMRELVRTIYQNKSVPKKLDQRITFPENEQTCRYQSHGGFGTVVSPRNFHMTSFLGSYVRFSGGVPS